MRRRSANAQSALAWSSRRSQRHRHRHTNVASRLRHVVRRPSRLQSDPRSLKFQQRFSARSENQELYREELRDPNTHILVALGSTGAGKTLSLCRKP